MLDSMDDMFEFNKASRNPNATKDENESSFAIDQNTMYRTLSFKEVKYQSLGSHPKESSLESQAAKIDFYLAQNAAVVQSQKGLPPPKIICAIEEERTEDEEESSHAEGFRKSRLEDTNDLN